MNKKIVLAAIAACAVAGGAFFVYAQTTSKVDSGAKSSDQLLESRKEQMNSMTLNDLNKESLDSIKLTDLQQSQLDKLKISDLNDPRFAALRPEQDASLSQLPDHLRRELTLGDFRPAVLSAIPLINLSQSRLRELRLAHLDPSSLATTRFDDNFQRAPEKVYTHRVKPQPVQASARQQRNWVGRHGSNKGSHGNKKGKKGKRGRGGKNKD